MSSCVQQKQIAYFQKALNQSDTLAVAQAYIPKIQPGDILAIPVGSLNPLASSFFNPYSTMPVTGDNVATSATSGGSAATSTSVNTPALVQSSAPGYLVDANGNIELQLIGKVKVGGLTTIAAKDTIQNRLNKYLKGTIVTVRFLNYKISVLGEVMRPSVYVIPNETITLPEAIGLAGDLTIYGKRDNILIIRDQDGKKVFGHIDLNSREVFSSPFYYLHANDVVYVEPGRGKIAQSDRTYQILPIVLSALSFISIILVYSKK
ncbi:MAG TPA: polysaccharide biosynthesis/export family protein [Mucilaginibacter sp.]|nr:polysaccharide biosynthesis/export family protein [Mucilaginibacter sp.]